MAYCGETDDIRYQQKCILLAQEPSICSVALQMQSATVMPLFIFTDVINVIINNVQDVFLLDFTSSPRETSSKDSINLWGVVQSAKLK